MNKTSKKIYEGDPKEPNSIQIVFSKDEVDEQYDLNEKIFKMLLEIFHDGMRKFNLKDDQVNLKELSDEDFYKIRQYFWSIGFDVFYNLKINNVQIRTTDDKTKKSDLKDYFLNLSIDEYFFTIFFDYY
tara:strand:+ start:875 stop:1261 length:387 start_codon:yes stop_codon:yes gene_type:complete